MNILHATIPIVAGGRQPQPVLHFLVPQRRDIIYLNLAVDQRTFNFITQDDMRRVAHLIGIDANKAGFHLLIPGDKIVLAKGRPIAKPLAHRR